MKQRETSFQQRLLVGAVACALASPLVDAATISVDSSDDSAASTACNLRKALASVAG